MAIDVRPKNRPQEHQAASRVYLTHDAAGAFRKLCRFTKKGPSELLEEMIRVYVRVEELELEVVEEQ